MGFSCLLGHDFGHPEHEQEREQHGEEIVLTTRDVKTCRRCGAEQVLTENTAVMKRDAVPAAVELDDDAESVNEPTEISPASRNEPAEAEIEPTNESTNADGESTNETANADVESTIETSNADDPTSIADQGSTPEPERTDVSTPETRQRDRVDTIDTSTDPDPDPERTPGVSRDEDGGTEAEPEITHDAVILTDEPETRDPMEWPEFGNEGKTSATDAGQRGTVADGGITPDVSPDASRLHCENCTSTWNPESSSLLAGDPCPSCRSAYVVQRSR